MVPLGQEGKKGKPDVLPLVGLQIKNWSCVVYAMAPAWKRTLFCMCSLLIFTGTPCLALIRGLKS